jgi:hypothetical protein
MDTMTEPTSAKRKFILEVIQPGLAGLMVIAWVRHRYMQTPLLKAAFQIVVGGVIVFLAGILIGSS